MKIYISGPMNGLHNFNRPAFLKAEQRLTKLGHYIYNPATWTGHEKDEFNIRDAFASHCNYLTTRADAIFMLRDWTTSDGAIFERLLALRIGLLIFEEEEQSRYFYNPQDGDAQDEEPNNAS